MDDNPPTTNPASDTPSVPANKEVAELITIEGSIKNHLRMLEELQNELKQQREMLKSFLDNDETYVKAVDTAKKATGLKNQAKKALLTTVEGSELNEKVRSLNSQKKELQEGLSYYLREFQRLTGSNHFEDDQGEVREIVYIAKLVKRTNWEK